MRREKVISILKRHKAELAKKYGVTKLGIFGSMARNEAVESSDVDVVVEMKVPDLFTMVDLKNNLELILETKVDIVRYWNRMNRYLKKRIDDEARYV